MEQRNILPVGQHPCDPLKKDIDPIGFALERLQTHLTWIEEHRASFQKARVDNPVGAEKELVYLAHSNREALRHLVRLTELLLAGHTIDPQKRLPRGLFTPQWCAWFERFLQASEDAESEAGASA